jgi:hypothetical protein
MLRLLVRLLGNARASNTGGALKTNPGQRSINEQIAARHPPPYESQTPDRDRSDQAHRTREVVVFVKRFEQSAAVERFERLERASVLFGARHRVFLEVAFPIKKPALSSERMPFMLSYAAKSRKLSWATRSRFGWSLFSRLLTGLGGTEAFNNDLT